MSAAGAAVLRRLEKVGGRRAAARLCSVDALGPRAAAGGHLPGPKLRVWLEESHGRRVSGCC
jgi:hypothetical protein